MDEQKRARAEAGDGAGRSQDSGGGRVTLVDFACTCDFYDFPHHHSPLDKKISLQRFRNAGPPLTKEEAARIYEDRI